MGKSEVVCNPQLQSSGSSCSKAGFKSLWGVWHQERSYPKASFLATFSSVALWGCQPTKGWGTGIYLFFFPLSFLLFLHSSLNTAQSTWQASKTALTACRAFSSLCVRLQHTIRDVLAPQWKHQKGSIRLVSPRWLGSCLLKIYQSG